MRTNPGKSFSFADAFEGFSDEPQAPRQKDPEEVARSSYFQFERSLRLGDQFALGGKRWQVVKLWEAAGMPIIAKAGHQTKWYRLWAVAFRGSDVEVGLVLMGPTGDKVSDPVATDLLSNVQRL